MHRFMVLAITALLTAAPAIAQTSPAPSAEPAASALPASPAANASATNITGDWVTEITGDQLLVGNLHFTQVGDTVVGSAEAGKGTGVLQISGTLQGTKLSGKWRGPKGNTGWITFNFNPSLSGFSGQWGYGGREPNGTIVSRKFTSTPF
jgi:hypothetical protein